MSFIIVTSNNGVVNIDFGVYGGVSVSTGAIPFKRSIPREQFAFSLLSNYIEAHVFYIALTMPITHNGANSTLKVDSVNGVAPTDLDNLYQLLNDM